MQRVFLHLNVPTEVNKELEEFMGQYMVKMPKNQAVSYIIKDWIEYKKRGFEVEKEMIKKDLSISQKAPKNCL